MGSENFNVLKELKSLDEQVASAGDLAGLKPIFYRLDEIAKQYSDDFEVQLAVGDVKQHLVTRGAILKEQRDRAPDGSNLPSTMTMAAQPSSEPPPSDLSHSASQRIPTSPLPVPPIPQDDPFSAANAEPLNPSAELHSRPSMAVPSQVAPGPPRPPAPPPPPSARPQMDWKRAILFGVLGGLVLTAIFMFMVNRARKNEAARKAAEEVAVDIVTVPPGASIRVNSETKCTSNCQVSLRPGSYDITASLDGYEPSANGVTLVAGQPKSLNLTLEPQTQSVRILTDFDKGKVALDEQPSVDLQDGQYQFEKVSPGPHTITVTSGKREASFSVELASAKLPSITGTVSAKNALAVLVASFATQAHVATSGTESWKLAVNGQDQADVGPAGADLKTFLAGVNDIVIRNGDAQYNVNQTFGTAPMLTAKIVTPEQNTGTLIVATDENDVTVFLKDKQQRSRTKRGQLKVPWLGSVTVRVSKQGFEDQPAKTADVKKGEEVRLEFKMKPLAQFSSLEVVGAASGTEVHLDQRPLGAVSSDGGFHNSSIAPGNHSIELVRPQFTTRTFERSFRAGQTVTLTGSDVVLTAERVATPAPAPPPESPKPPPPAPKPSVATVVPPAPRTAGMESFDDPSQWMEANGVFRHAGKGFFTYRVPPNGGVFTFNIYMIRGGNILKGARLRWRVGYIDDKNYTLFELDEDTFYATDVVNGKATARKRKHNIPSKDKKDKVWAMKIDLSADKVVHQIQNDQDWVTVDGFAPPGRNLTNGKFGFLLQGGGDEMGLSDLTFKPH